MAASDNDSDNERGGGWHTLFFIPCVFGYQTIIEAA
jgi:hypothetical protein